MSKRQLIDLRHIRFSDIITMKTEFRYELNYFYILDELVGVVGVDLALDELFADAMYFRAAGDIAFTFLLDFAGRVVMHPFMPSPATTMSSPIITHFAAFEREELVQKFLRETIRSISTNKGPSGQQLQASDIFENVFNTVRLHATVCNVDVVYCCSCSIKHNQ